MSFAVSPAGFREVLRPGGRHPLVRRASRFLRGRLAGQVRPSTGESAIGHAERVAAIVRREFRVRAAETTALALLHDVLEDSDTAVEALETTFGPRLTGGVMALTKPTLGPKALRRRYFLRTLQHASDDVKLVKLADYLANLRTRRGTPRERSTRGGAGRFLAVLNATPQSAGVTRAIWRVQAEIRDSLARDEGIGAPSAKDPVSAAA